MSNVDASTSTASAAFQTTADATAWARRMRWVGRIISGLALLFLAMDAVIKLLQLAPAVDATVQLGYPAQLVLALGVLELACIAIYALPQTSVLGAILLTGYLGGAIASHLRGGSDLFSIIFPLLLGALLWAGLFVRDRRLRALLPWRRSADA